jgi:predicted nucleic acid-binding protein
VQWDFGGIGSTAERRDSLYREWMTDEVIATYSSYLIIDKITPDMHSFIIRDPDDAKFRFNDEIITVKFESI